MTLPFLETNVEHAHSVCLVCNYRDYFELLEPSPCTSKCNLVANRYVDSSPFSLSVFLPLYILSFSNVNHVDNALYLRRDHRGQQRLKVGRFYWAGSSNLSSFYFSAWFGKTAIATSSSAHICQVKNLAW